MSLLTILQPLLNAKTGAVNITLSKAADNQLTLLVQPVCAVDDHQDTALITLKAALSIPIKIVGESVADIEQALASRIANVQPKRDEWDSQVAVIEATLKAAKEAKADKSKPAATSKTPTKAAPAKPAVAPKAAPAVAGDSALADEELFEL